MTEAKPKTALRHEWSYMIEADDITVEGRTFTISAAPEECKDIARRLQVVSVEALTADILLKREPGGHVIRAEGEVKALVTQNCVVSLEPVAEEVCEPISAWYMDEAQAVSFARARHERLGRGAEAELPVLEEKDDPEPIIDGQIDLGELAAQYLALGVNPYPHKEGVVSDNIEKADSVPLKAPSRPNPFEALKKWKEDKEIS